MGFQFGGVLTRLEIQASIESVMRNREMREEGIEHTSAQKLFELQNFVKQIQEVDRPERMKP